MKDNSHSNPVEVFAGTSLDAGIIQSMLEQEGVQAFINNELMGSIAPWQVEAGGAGAAKVVVSELDYEKAIQIINDYGQDME
jgi:hypothetical protein